jgi:hypothetical protein
LETGRCAREYTDSEITKNYGDFTSSQVEALRRFPCIFAYETGCKKDPKFGILRDIVKRQGKVKIEYELVDLDPFIKHESHLFFVVKKPTLASFANAVCGSVKSWSCG